MESVLRRAGITYTIQKHAPTFMVSESMHIVPEKMPTKCLLLEDSKSGQPFMVAMRGDIRLNVPLLGATLGAARLRFCSQERMHELIGVAPGHVSVFSLLNDQPHQVTLVVDDGLLEADTIGFHPNVNTATVYMHPSDIATFCNAVGATYNIVQL